MTIDVDALLAEVADMTSLSTLMLRMEAALRQERERADKYVAQAEMQCSRAQRFQAEVARLTAQLGNYGRAGET